MKTFHMTLLGERDVGKTAFTVKLLTGRFIYDYDKGCDVPYNYECIIDDDEKIQAQIFDASSPVTLSFKRFNFANHETDLYVLIYSISESKSFLYIRKLLEHFITLKGKNIDIDIPIAIVGNKSDTSHFREVTKEDVLGLSEHFQAILRLKYFDEISVARDDVRKLFLDVYDWSREQADNESNKENPKRSEALF